MGRDGTTIPHAIVGAATNIHLQHLLGAKPLSSFSKCRVLHYKAVLQSISSSSVVCRWEAVEEILGFPVHHHIHKRCQRLTGEKGENNGDSVLDVIVLCISM